ncbi:MAG: U32 family peptidase [Elusimicrobiales bacterium]|jgi:putative protease
MTIKTIELLAPAKDLPAGLEAVNCGADAVYIGAEEFGARAAAGNTLRDIEKLAVYAHRYRAKVYAAVNTILTDLELGRAHKLICRLWEAGVDAVIIQDMGLLELDLPPVPLFASTQTHNITPEKVLFLEKTGFKRIILGRELSLEEIKAVRAATKVDLEFFVHGSLCVSYSGQCYLSHALGGRSGNRGECAQPCRKLYTLKDGAGKELVKNKHLLSLKDLNLSKRLGGLLDAGITSFKIEGRLKDASYVKNVVSYYRRELDKVLARKRLGRSSAGKSFIEFAPDLNKSFNRGYTEYFLDGEGSDAASPDTPKFIGEPVGRAIKVDARSFRLEGGAPIHNGDGLAFFDDRGVLGGAHVNIVVDGRIMPVSTRGISEGTAIYRNLDREFDRTLERARPERKLGVRLKFGETPEGFALNAEDEEGFKARVACASGKIKAEKPEAALETIKRQLSKIGETAFYLRDLEVDLSAPYFIPVSVLNDLRRKALERLESSRGSEYVRAESKFEKTSHKYPAEELDFTANILNSKAVEFYKRHGVARIERAAEFGAEIAGRPLMTIKACLRRRLKMCPKADGDPVGKAGPLYLEDEEGRLFRLDFDCPSCRMTLKLGK